MWSKQWALTRFPGLPCLPPGSMSLSLVQKNYPKRDLWWGDVDGGSRRKDHILLLHLLRGFPLGDLSLAIYLIQRLGMGAGVGGMLNVQRSSP